MVQTDRGRGDEGLPDFEWPRASSVEQERPITKIE